MKKIRLRDGSLVDPWYPMGEWTMIYAEAKINGLSSEDAAKKAHNAITMIEKKSAFINEKTCIGCGECHPKQSGRSV